MTTQAMQVMHSSVESDWRTPPECFEALDREFQFGLDAAADEGSHLTPRWLGPGSVYADALAVADWALVDGYSLSIFLNPPFSRTKARSWKGNPDRNPFRIANWAKKCWEESQRGATIVGLFPFAPQTDWYRRYVYGHRQDGGWEGHAAKEERRLPHRISFLHPEGKPAANAGVNTTIIVWGPMKGAVGPWLPHAYYWSWK